MDPGSDTRLRPVTQKVVMRLVADTVVNFGELQVLMDRRYGDQPLENRTL